MSYSPARIVGALRRRKNDLLRSALYKPNSKSKLDDAVLFQSFEGKSVSDSPLDIFYYLQKSQPNLKFYWTVRSGVVPPDGSTAVKFGSRAWLTALANSKYLVNNSAFPWYFKKSAGQTYLQTWHGTPLKKLVQDIEAGKVSPQYLSMMRNEATAWDFLISPSAYASAAFKTAFGFPSNKTNGKVLEIGYPRNDRIAKPSSQTREQVRKQLGIKSAQTQLVLYAPTWRDTAVTALGNMKSVNYLDANTKLPKGFQLMYRGHSMTHDAHSTKSANGAIDVTKYPDIAELFLAADILITDYSSVMFDFAITGKPIIFLTPDIEDYVADRGFYFDFVHEAPGPICHNTAEVMGALENINDVAKQYSKAYKAWQAKFAPLDDGKAAERAVSAVFK